MCVTPVPHPATSSSKTIEPIRAVHILNQGTNNLKVYVDHVFEVCVVSASKGDENFILI
jgi:hypothetical protein